MFRSLGLILSGNVASAALMMARTLLVSRLISLEDFGVGSIFLLTLAMIEMMTALGLQQQMAQSADGDSPSFQNGLQGFAAIRGIFCAGLLLLIASPLASFFGIPQALWAFQLIAFVPLVLGFTHFDAHRFGRQMAFGPTVTLGLLPPAASLLSVWPLYQLFGDYRVLLFSILVQTALSFIVSHGVAKRPYRLCFDRSAMQQSLRFGWPLMVSGALLFLVFHGERSIIALRFSLETLALFSMALSLTLTPALVISRSTMSFFLPQLSAARGTRSYAGLVTATLQAHIFMGCAMVVCVALFGGPFLLTVLSEKYAAAIPLLVWLATLYAVRVFAGGCAIVALAAGHTKNEVITNLVRVSLLPVAWLAVKDGGNVMILVWIGIVGEAAGFGVGLSLALGRQTLPLRPLIMPLAIAMLILGTAVMVGNHLSWGAAAALFSASLAVLALTMAELMTYLRCNTATGFMAET